jgi:acyl-CoA thioester hydrolase
MGLLYHVNHLEYFEVARSDWIRKFWRSYREIEDEGFCLVAIEARVRYHKPARYDELVEVHVRPVDWGRSRITFEYVILRPGETDPICTGQTRHCFVDRGGKAVRMPEELRRRLTESYTA